MKQKQKTVKASVFFHGIGVHSGQSVKLVVQPNYEGSGIVFQHQDFPDEPIIIGTVMPEHAMHATVIKQKRWMLSTIEHLMAVFHVFGITQAVVHMSAYEVPILDGSALPFVQGLLEVGLHDLSGDLNFLTPKAPLLFADEQGRILEILPAGVVDRSRDCSLYIDYTADFSNPLLGTTQFVGCITPQLFEREIAPARTFGFLEQLPLLRQHGLCRGSSLGNSVVIGEDGFLNERRFADECVRHKVLDLLGDLANLGKPLAGRVRAAKTGHSFNRLVIEHYLKNPDQWDVI